MYVFIYVWFLYVLICIRIIKYNYVFLKERMILFLYIFFIFVMYKIKVIL